MPAFYDFQNSSFTGITMDKTLIGIYKDFTTACEVVRDLTECGFAREQIDLVACPNTAPGLFPRSMRPSVRWGGGVGVLLGGMTGLVLAILHENTFTFHLATLATSLALTSGSPLASAAMSARSPAHPPVPLEFWLTVALGVVIAGLTGNFAVMGYMARNPQGGSQLTLKTNAELVPCAIQIMKRYSPLHFEPLREMDDTPRMAPRPEKLSLPSPHPEGTELLRLRYDKRARPHTVTDTEMGIR